LNRREPEPAPQVHLPAAYRIARFARFYGMTTYRGASMRWPTRDGVIPANAFFAMERQIAHVSAAEQLQSYYAVLLGTAAVMGGKEGRSALDAAVTAVKDLAYPDEAHAHE
jgi:hypothetical protein